MTKNIFEELPARKHSPAAATPAAKKETGEGGSEKRIRQAVYDIRYRARREEIDLRAAFAQYMQNSNLSAPEQAAVRAKLFGKDGGGEKKESYTPLMTDGATTSVANAMFKVFVEDQQVPEFVYEDEGGDRKYKVRVTDPKTEKSYVRYADRAKITELRAKGLKVEMTEHGDPYEGTKREGEGEKKKKGKLDPVGKEDKDVDNDGDHDKTDKYLLNRRAAIGKAMAKKKDKMSEEFIGEVASSKQKQIGVDNYKPLAKGMQPAVQVMPIDGADLANNQIGNVRKEEVSPARKRLFDMIKEQQVVAEAVCEKCGKSPCECPKGEKKEDECTPNERKTYRELLKNKLRAMGMKNPLVMMGDDTPENVMKVMTSSSATMASEATVLAQQGGVPGTVEVEKTKEGGFLGIGAKTVSKPVPGTFEPKNVSSKDAARYNTAIDNRFKGHSGSADETPATAIQRAAQRSGHSGYMKVKDPSSIPNTGIPNRPTPARSRDQNDAMSWQVGNKFKK